MVQIDDLIKNGGAFTRGRTSYEVTLLPDPEVRYRYFPLISVDDHFIEAENMFEGRFPAVLTDRAPHVIEEENGDQVWVFEDRREAHTGLNAVVGRPLEECGMEPTRFDAMRRGTWDPAARVRDMNINGVYASLNFPSALPGFAGQRLQLGGIDEELALATVRAWNMWALEEWVQPNPERFIACQVPWLRDPQLAADEIRRNAELGFKAVSFSEGPDKLGLPSLHTGYWEQFIQACEETGTVICLHVGSSSTLPEAGEGAPADTQAVLFFSSATVYTVDWLFSGIPTNHPDLKIVMSEGGTGWVAGLIDRLRHVSHYQQLFGNWNHRLTPAEVLQRNFYFCAIDDPASFKQVDEIGVDNLLLETDYPHLDSSWPDSQEMLHEHLKHLSATQMERITWRNASEVFRHPVPASVQADPNSF
jgi:predicted TIM-barrel fold metal-dependent hydrolase